MIERIKNKNKFLLGASALAVLVLIAVLLVSLFSEKSKKGAGQLEAGPEFMSLEEKKAFGLPEESKIQVLKREADGTTAVYKVIRSDEEIIYNADSIAPIDPLYD